MVFCGMLHSLNKAEETNTTDTTTEKFRYIYI